MSSSSTRMAFKVADLQKTVDKHLKASIEAAEQTYRDTKPIKVQQEEWRAEQEKRIKALSREVKDMSDADLKDWKIEERPSKGYRYEDPKSIRDKAIAAATANHERATRRLDAVHTEDGVLTLTQQMLSDWFGL